MKCNGMNSNKNDALINNTSNSIPTKKQSNHKHQDSMMDKMIKENELNNRSKLEKSIKTNLGNKIDQMI